MAGHNWDFSYDWYEDVYATVNASCARSRIMCTAQARYKNGNNPYYTTEPRDKEFNL